jgi:hypothetical protein
LAALPVPLREQIDEVKLFAGDRALALFFGGGFC